MKYRDHKYLGYPGMSSLEEVEVEEVFDDQWVTVRPLGSDDVIKVSTSRLFDHAYGLRDAGPGHVVV